MKAGWQLAGSWGEAGRGRATGRLGKAMAPGQQGEAGSQWMQRAVRRAWRAWRGMERHGRVSQEGTATRSSDRPRCCYNSRSFALRRPSAARLRRPRGASAAEKRRRAVRACACMCVCMHECVCACTSACMRRGWGGEQRAKRRPSSGRPAVRCASDTACKRPAANRVPSRGSRPHLLLHVPAQHRDALAHVLLRIGALHELTEVPAAAGSSSRPVSKGPLEGCMQVEKKGIDTSGRPREKQSAAQRRSEQQANEGARGVRLSEV